MNEWEFTAEVSNWINETLMKIPSLPFYRAKCEQSGTGSRKRRDLTLWDKDRRIILTGEVKLPYRHDGGSPYNTAVVNDARSKALKADSPFFFTWNVNEFVLWETETAKSTWQEQKYKSWDVTSVHREEHLESPMTIHAIKNWLPLFLDEFARISLGTSVIGTKPPDEKFIEALESFLHIPILLSIEELDHRYTNPSLRLDLDKWMRDEQGWVISHDPEAIRDNLERASQFSCYALVNKLVFHEALLKRYAPSMSKLLVPDHIDTGEKLRLHLESYFSEAKKITHDYETVFGEDRTSVGNRIPFYSDRAVIHWRELINQIHLFDFSKLDYEIIGNIFERLIAPEERRKYGQFYTKVEVVDLINSFCITNGVEKIMDPACGGGTFLVRAYARKRELNPSRKHGELLTDLFGIDISHFATHLTTINLATRDLIDTENYPQISRNDFFNIDSGKTFLTLPGRIDTSGLGKHQHRSVTIPEIDAVVGNPPYIRQEEIPKAKKKDRNHPERGTKDFYQYLTTKESGIKLSGRSDIHCYFWIHATTFLRDNGYLCFLTSSQWLDVEYGFRLQEFILNNFEIVAILESLDEPWFIGARVTTTVTILRKQTDEEKRTNNIVRFVQFRRPLTEILASDGTTAGAVAAADRFRDEILALKHNVSNERYRVRTVSQGELRQKGVELGSIMSKMDDEDDEERETNSSSYYGGKWGIYLRAPDLWFDLQDKTGDKWTNLGNIADIKRGVTTGCDDFFFVHDVTQQYLAKYQDEHSFKQQTGYSRNDFASGRVKLVACGKNHDEIKAIEAEFLEPEVHSLMEIEGFTITHDDCSRYILLADQSMDFTKNRYLQNYIKWGESQKLDTGSTCASRASQKRAWYDLTGHKRGQLFWPMAQQYKHSIPSNDDTLICNHNLFDIFPLDISADVLGGILNSSWVVLSKFQFGRPVGVEGNLKTEVIDVKMMRVPDPRNINVKLGSTISAAFQELKKRKALQFLSERRMRGMAYKQSGRERELDNLSDLCELDMPDRRQLDDAVLQLLGIKVKKRRDEMINELHDYLRQYFEWTRQKEEKAILNKKRAARRELITPDHIAEQIYNEISSNHPQLLRYYEQDFLNRSKPFDTYEIPLEGVAEPFSDMFIEHGVRFSQKGKATGRVIETVSRAQDDLLIIVANAGVRGLVCLPHNDAECSKLGNDYDKFIRQRDDRIKELISERTADEDLQEDIYIKLHKLLVNPVN